MIPTVGWRREPLLRFPRSSSVIALRRSRFEPVRRSSSYLFDLGPSFELYGPAPSFPSKEAEKRLWASTDLLLS